MLQTVATNMIHNINRCWWRAGWLRLSTTVGSELNGCAATEPDSLRPANCFAATEYANLDVYDCVQRVWWLRCDWIRLLAAGFHNIVRLVCFHNTSQTKQSIQMFWSHAVHRCGISFDTNYYASKIHSKKNQNGQFTSNQNTYSIMDLVL